MKFSKFLIGVASLALGCVTGFAQTSFLAYTDRTAWRGASGGDQMFFVDFNQYTTDVPASGPLDVGPFTLTPQGTWNVPLIDAPPLIYGSVDGTAGVMARVGQSSGVSLVIQFAQPIHAFGFDYAYDLNRTDPLVLTTSNGDSHTITSIGTTPQFLGLVAGEPFTSITVTSTSSIIPLFDNFEGFGMMVTTKAPYFESILINRNVGQAAAGLTEYHMTITYADDDGSIDATSISPANISVPRMTVSRGFVSSGGSRYVNAQYTLTPPGGYWDEADNGTYTVSVVANQVRDNQGAFVPAGQISSFTVSIDTTGPVLESIARGAPAHEVTNSDSLVFRVTFSEAVSNLDASDFVVEGTTATVMGVSSVGSGRYNVGVWGGDLADLDGVVSLGICESHNITDSAGNALMSTVPLANETYTVDNTGPTVSIVGPEEQVTAGTPLSYAVQYSGASSTSLTAADVTLHTTGTVEAMITVQTWGMFDYTISVLSISGAGTISLSIAEGTATDAAGNRAAAVEQTEPILVTDGIQDSTGNFLVSGEPTSGINETYNIVFNNAAEIGGLAPEIEVDDDATTLPFASVTLDDLEDDPVVVLVTLDNAAKGGFTPASLEASGFTLVINGIYRLTERPAAEAQAALRQLVFAPTPNRAAVGGAETTVLTVFVNDGISLSEASISVIAMSINDAPTGILFDGSDTVWVADPDGIAMGTFTAVDPDHATHTFTLLDIDGDADHPMLVEFSVHGAQLRVDDPSALEAGTYVLRVRATDGAGASVEASFTFHVEDRVMVTTVSDEGASVGETVAQSMADGQGLSLREALHFAQRGAVVEFDPSLDGATFTLLSPITVAGEMDGIGIDTSALTSMTITGSSIEFGMTVMIAVEPGSESVIETTLAGAGNLMVLGGGNLVLRGDHLYEGATMIQGATLTLDGSLASLYVMVVEGTLAGVGDLAGLLDIQEGSTVAPGIDGPGRLSIHGGADFNPGSRLLLEVNGTTPGIDHDQLIVGVGLNLAGASLELVLGEGYVPSGADTLTIIGLGDGQLPFNPFADLAEGTAVTIDGHTFAISYLGGNGGDVVLIGNRPPAAPSLQSPVNYNNLTEHGRTLQRRPMLFWTIPSDPDHNHLHFEVSINGETYSSAEDNWGFEYFDGTEWLPLGQDGAGSLQYGAVARFMPEYSLLPDTYEWTVRAHDGYVFGSSATTRTFVIGLVDWHPVLGAGQRISRTFVNELRAEINHARQFRGLEPIIWTDALTANQSIVRAIHIEEMRAALGEALEAGGESVPTWTPLVPDHSLIRVEDFEQIRDALSPKAKAIL